MRDIDIRKLLLLTLQKKYNDDIDTLIIEELGLCQGDSRVDLAVINGSIHGYEIKSERDTLNRLSAQQDIYCKIFDCVTVVASSCHVAEIRRQVPKWWGLKEAQYSDGKINLVDVRLCRKNTAIDPKALVQLLWREEALEILKERNLHKGIVSKPRDVLWDRIISRLPLKELRCEVRNRIKKRQQWRSVKQQG